MLHFQLKEFIDFQKNLIILSTLARHLPSDACPLPPSPPPTTSSSSTMSSLSPPHHNNFITAETPAGNNSRYNNFDSPIFSSEVNSTSSPDHSFQDGLTDDEVLACN